MLMSGPIEQYLEQMDQAAPDDEFEEMLGNRHAEAKTFEDLESQRGTPIPLLFSQLYKFIQNPSTVSVETYKRMVDTDDTIGSGVDFLTSCLVARRGRYQHKSNEITEWVNDALDKMDGGWTNAGKEMLSASWVGFSVQEKVWANTDMGFVPHKLVALPPSTILFEVERTGELTPDGILQYQRNWSSLSMGRGLGYFGGAIGFTGSMDARPDAFAKLGDLPFPLRTSNPFQWMSLRIPKLKCIHYAFDAQGKFGNPYGRSMLRRAYKYYVLKDALLQMLAIAMDRKGTPLTIVYADPNTTLEDPDKNINGENARDIRSKGIKADQAAKNAFKNIHNDSVIILPGKKGEIFDVTEMGAGSNSGDFIAALDFCNKSIMRALMIPSLIFTNGDGTGSFALGQEHAKTFDKICDSIMAGANQVVLQQLIYEMIAYNFPRSAWEKDGLGSFSKRELTRDEIEKEMQMYEGGINNGIIDQRDLNDLNKMRESIGFEPVDKPIEKPGMAGMMGMGMGADGKPAPKLEEKPNENKDKDPKDKKDDQK